MCTRVFKSVLLTVYKSNLCVPVQILCNIHILIYNIGGISSREFCDSGPSVNCTLNCVIEHCHAANFCSIIEK